MTSPDTLERLVDQTTRTARGYAGLVVAAFAGPHTAVAATGTSGPSGAPLTAHTLFQVGSVTKVFTAVALADAVVRGQLSLDTPLATCLPELDKAPSGRVTLGQLAAHTSGLPALPPGLRRQALRNRLDPYRGFGTDDLLAGAARARLRGGSGSRYSNFGAALLGEALSRHDAVSYDRLIERRVTGPLRLTDTVAHPSPEQLSRKATGHARPRRPVPDWDLGGMPAAGVLYSTARDLTAFGGAHLRPCATDHLGRALSLVQQRRATANRWVDVGLAWHLMHVRGTGHTALWHNGGTGGFAAYLALLPARDAGVAILTNTARPVDRLGLHALQALAMSAPA